MTRIEKSESQNIAEAAAPEDRDLDAAIRVHRILFRVETGILRLHDRTGETTERREPGESTPKRKTNGWPRDLRMPFSHDFQSYLDEQYGAFPWSKALLFLRWNVCRRTHPQHWEREEWGGSLCYSLVSYVIRHETSLDYARLQLGLPEEGKTRRTLDSALLVMERRLEALLSEDKAKQSLPARTPQEWMAAAFEHRSLPGLHSEECPQCRRSAA